MKKLSTIEVNALFGLSPKDLKEMRIEGMDYHLLSGAYWYNYDDIVNHLK